MNAFVQNDLWDRKRSIHASSLAFHNEVFHFTLKLSGPSDQQGPSGVSLSQSALYSHQGCISDKLHEDFKHRLITCAAGAVSLFARCQTGSRRWQGSSSTAPPAVTHPVTLRTRKMPRRHSTVATTEQLQSRSDWGVTEPDTGRVWGGMGGSWTPAPDVSKKNHTLTHSLQCTVTSKSNVCKFILHLISYKYSFILQKSLNIH